MPENNIELAGNTNIKTSQVDKSVDTPADFTSPEVLYNKLIETIRQYHPSSDLSDIERAYKVAKEAHEGQFRKSGEPYIIHPLCVAIILAELELDKESIIAGLLHDVVEDTEMSREDITQRFGAVVAHLVDAVADVLPVVRSFPLVRGMRSFGCPHILNGFVNGKGLSRLFVPCRRLFLQGFKSCLFSRRVFFPQCL